MVNDAVEGTIKFEQDDRLDCMKLKFKKFTPEPKEQCFFFDTFEDCY